MTSETDYSPTSLIRSKCIDNRIFVSQSRDNQLAIEVLILHTEVPFTVAADIT